MPKVEKSFLTSPPDVQQPPEGGKHDHRGEIQRSPATGWNYRLLRRRPGKLGRSSVVN